MNNEVSKDCFARGVHGEPKCRVIEDNLCSKKKLRTCLLKKLIIFFIDATAEAVQGRATGS